MLELVKDNSLFVATRQRFQSVREHPLNACVAYNKI